MGVATRPDPSQLVTELRVHIGAHKTATTHLQDSISAAMPEVTALGVNYVPRGVLRRGVPWWRLKGKPGRQPNSANHFAPVLTLVREKLLECVTVPGPFAISEENLLGGTHMILEDKLYPDLARLRLVTRLWPDRPLRLFLCIRSLDGFLPSAYCEALRHGRLRREDLDDARRRYLPRPNPWFQLVTRIRTIAPEASLEVWNYDEYRQHWLEMHRSFLGLPDIRIAGVADPLTTRRLSEAMVDEAERLPADLKGQPRMEAVDRIVLRHIERDPGAHPFSPFSDHDAARFREQFQRDLKAIEARFPGVLRSFRSMPATGRSPALSMSSQAPGVPTAGTPQAASDRAPQPGQNGGKSRTAFVFLGHKLFPRFASQIAEARADLAGKADVHVVGYFRSADEVPDIFRQDPSFHAYGPKQIDVLRPAAMRAARAPGSYKSGDSGRTLLAFALDHPQYDLIWLWEYDVVFTGSLAELVDAFAASPGDLLGTNIVKPRKDWKALPTGRAPKGWPAILKDPDRGFFPVARLSRRFVEEARRFHLAGGEGHYELVWPYVARTRGLEMEDLGGRGPYVRAGNRNRFYTSTSWAPGLFPGTFRFRPVLGRPGRRPSTLYHPVKEKAEPPLQAAWERLGYWARLPRYLVAHLRQTNAGVFRRRL